MPNAQIYFHLPSFYITFAEIFLKRMPKVKTNSSAKKRFFVTGTGKVRRKSAYMAHKLNKKSKSAKRRLGKSTNVHDADLKNVKGLLNIG